MTKKIAASLPHKMTGRRVYVGNELRYVADEFQMIQIIEEKLGVDVGDYLREWYEELVFDDAFCRSEIERIEFERRLRRFG